MKQVVLIYGMLIDIFIISNQERGNGEKSTYI